MPEYLSPGVYVEEVPPRLRAIEGVSTSTAGFVGPAERGPVPGYPLPFDPQSGHDGGTITLSRDPAPVLVTSYGEFRRVFGGPLPLPDPNEHAYLERAVRAFFNNGGKRCYVSRVVHRDPEALGNSATLGHLRLHQGCILLLTRRGEVESEAPLYLNTLRGISNDALLTFVRRDAPTVTVAEVTVASYDTQRGTVTPRVALDANLEPGEVYAIAPAITTPPPQVGPRFWARNPGSWSTGLRVLVCPADKGATPLTAPVAADAPQIRVRSSAGFYRGAIVEIDTGTERHYREVLNLLPGNVVELTTGVADGIADPTHAFARVVEIDITVTDEAASPPITETFRGLTWNPSMRPETRRRYYAAVINNRSRLVTVQPPGYVDSADYLESPATLSGSEDASIGTQPTTVNGFEVGPAPADVGADNYALIVPADYVGEDLGPGARTGIQALRDMDDISIIAAPGRTEPDVHNALIAQCENLRYRFAILDGERDPLGGSINSILGHRNLYDSSYAAYYQPWLEVGENGDRLNLPPSGFMAGIYARSDIERGVHKAPANEVVRGITGLRSYITTGEQDILNPRGVNAIRQFEGRGIRVWGARTLSSDPALRYISTRRFLIFLEKSIDRGTQWVVFEPNHPATWSRVTDSVGSFLHTQWRAGALLGRTPEQAYFVRCDETTMTADDIENGRLICEIGVAIVKPAEFVIFRIEQIAAFGTT